MVRALSLSAGAALLVLAACAPSTKPQPLTAADSTAVTNISATYATAWNKGDVDGIVALYGSDAVQLLPDTAPLQGSNAVRTYLNTTLGTPRRPVLVLSPSSLVGRQDLAVAAGAFTLTLPADTAAAKGGAAAAPAPLAGHYLTVLMKRPDGSWKISSEAISYDAPKPVPAPAKPARRGR